MVHRFHVASSARRLMAVAAATAALALPAESAPVVQSIVIDASPDLVWAAVRDTADIDRCLLPGLIVSSTEVDGVRTLHFADGRTSREAILSIDDAVRHLDFAAVSEGPNYRTSSMQVSAEGSAARLQWTSDVRPDALVAGSAAFIRKGLEIAKRHLERPPAQLCR